MKLLDASITILVNVEYTEIRITNNQSNTDFVRAKLTPEQLSMCLSRMGNTKCEVDVYGLDKIGKTHENTKFEFEILDSMHKKGNEVSLHATCIESLQKQGMEGWIPDAYYGSQDSFFSRNGKHFARVTIRRWV